MNTFFSNVRDGFRSAARSTSAFYRRNRYIVVGGLTVFSILLIIWARLGFTFQFSSFFAAAPGPTVVINSSLPIKHNQTLSVSWSANTATSCTASSWIDTGGKNEGTASSAPVDACAAASGTFSITCHYPDGTSGTTTKSFAIDKSTCPSAGTPAPTPTGGGGGAGGAVPVDPTGNCVWKTNFNAPSGDWFCKSLQCNLDGNPDAT
ncbi:MAG TPA: hypothetical protein VMJ72_01945, partial [Candidatus Paceibacterota bacterium]|nr:hypothetical protein [Candidatus Paceibacterota bacterium]